MMKSDGDSPFIATGELHNDISPKYICGINSIDEFETSYGEGGWTSEFYIPASKEAKKELFDKMAEAGYRWNADTLELEEIEPKFKEGDVVIDKDGDIYLVLKVKDSNFVTVSAVLYENHVLSIYNNFDVYRHINELTLASTTNRNKLSSALVREGFKYNKEQHKFIRQEFKPFDKVLIRRKYDNIWMPKLYAGFKENALFPYICVDGYEGTQCIPYEGNEYLLGTTDSPT